MFVILLFTKLDFNKKKLRFLDENFYLPNSVL